MALLDGKKKPPMRSGGMMSGGNTQREKFSAGLNRGGADPGMGKAPAKAGPETHGGGVGPEGQEGQTTISHHPDGSHSVKHSDGEETHHPSTGHMLMGMHAKHHPGESGGHMHEHGAGVTTHHVGMDGEVQGPHDHASPEDAGMHLASAVGGADEMGHGSGEPGMPVEMGSGDWA